MSSTTTEAGPHEAEIEISLFGPGLGESAVIHVGGGRWIVIDSCTVDGQCVPLKYLSSIGVDVASDVKLVVATHAHDDHVRGIGRLYEAAKEAKLALPMAATKEEFTALLALDQRQRDVRLRVYREYEALLKELRVRKEQGQRCWFGISGRLALLPEPGDQPPVEVFALSPSDEDVLLSLTDLGDMLPEPGSQPRRTSSRDPNHFAMAIQVTVGDRVVTLGSDVLRGTAAESTGWSAILAEHRNRLPATQIIKVAHHGSVTGHHEDTWSEMASDGIVAMVTPFLQGSVRLPKTEDVDRLKELADQLYTTAGAPTLSRAQQRLAAAVTGSARGVHLTQGQTGQVRARAPIHGPHQWQVDALGFARQL